MDFSTIIMAIGVIISGIFFLRTKKTISKIIIGTQCIFTLMSILSPTEQTFLKTIGLIGFLLSILSVVIYGFIEKNFGKNQKLFIYIVMIPVCLMLISILMSWPFAGIFKLLMIIPIIGLCIALCNRQALKNEIGLLVLPGFYALYEFINHWIG